MKIQKFFESINFFYIQGRYLRLPTLQALVLIEELGSIRSAAQAMSLTQPALTAAIQQLEAELKAPLLVRSRTGVTFTNFGQAFLRHAKFMVAPSRRHKTRLRSYAGIGRAP